MGAVRLVRDVVDGQLVGRRGVKMGRVDGLTLELRPGGPPRVADVLIGAPILADRLGGWMVKLLALFEKVGIATGRVTRIPFDAVRVIGEVIEVDIDPAATPALRTERAIGEHVISRIPGANGEGKGEKK